MFHLFCSLLNILEGFFALAVVCCHPKKLLKKKTRERKRRSLSAEDFPDFYFFPTLFRWGLLRKLPWALEFDLFGFFFFHCRGCLNKQSETLIFPGCERGNLVCETAGFSKEDVKRKRRRRRRREASGIVNQGTTILHSLGSGSLNSSDSRIAG